MALAQRAGPPDLAGPWVSSTGASCVVPAYAPALDFTIKVQDAQGRNPARYSAHWHLGEQSGRWYFSYRTKSGERILGRYDGTHVLLQSDKGGWSSKWTRY